MPLLHRRRTEEVAVQPQTESLDYHLINNKALQWHHHSSRHVQKRVLGYISSPSLPLGCLCTPTSSRQDDVIAELQACETSWV